MRYVIDANDCLKWVLPEPDSVDAIAVRDDFVAGVHELLAPDLLPIEAGYVLTRMHRKGLIRDPEHRLRLFLATSPVLHPHLPLIPRAMQISVRHRVGVYDCLYVALAEREGCPVITADQRMINSLQPQFPFVVHFTTV